MGQITSRRLDEIKLNIDAIMRLLNSPNTGGDALDRIARMSSSYFKEKVTQHKNTWDATIERLSHDENPEVRNAAETARRLRRYLAISIRT